MATWRGRTLGRWATAPLFRSRRPSAAGVEEFDRAGEVLAADRALRQAGHPGVLAPDRRGRRVVADVRRRPPRQLVEAYRRKDGDRAKELIYEHAEQVKQLARTSIDAVGGQV